MSSEYVPRPWETARPWYLGALAVGLTVLLTWLLVGVLHVGRDDVAAGTIYQGADSDQEYRGSASVRVPSSPTLALSWTSPQSRLPEDFAKYQADGPQLPPVDGSWVGIKWEPADNRYIGTIGSLPPAGRLPALAVIAGGHTYPLQSPKKLAAYCGDICTTRDALWIAIDGDGSDLVLTVTFDGVTQKVNGRSGGITPGGAAGLYATAPLDRRDVSCGTPVVREGVKITYGDCNYTAASTPWTPTQHWAPTGQVWTFLRIARPDRIYIERIKDQDVPSADNTAATTYTVTGARIVSRTGVATRELADGASSQGATTTLTLAGATGVHPRLTVTAVYPLENSDDGPLTAATASVTLTWTVTL